MTSKTSGWSIGLPVCALILHDNVRIRCKWSVNQSDIHDYELTWETQITATRRLLTVCIYFGISSDGLQQQQQQQIAGGSSSICNAPRVFTDIEGYKLIGNLVAPWGPRRTDVCRHVLVRRWVNGWVPGSVAPSCPSTDLVPTSTPLETENVETIAAHARQARQMWILDWDAVVSAAVER